LNKRNDLNVELTGFVSFGSGNGHARFILGLPVLGSGDQLQALVKEYDVSRIIVALEDRRNTLPTKELVGLRVQGVRVEDAHSTMAALTGRVWLETVKPSWFVFSDGFYRSAVTLCLKRALDLACGMVGLVVSLPAMALAALAVKLDS